MDGAIQQRSLFGDIEIRLHIDVPGVLKRQKLKSGKAKLRQLRPES
jgi:hypothetical protein